MVQGVCSHKESLIHINDLEFRPLGLAADHLQEQVLVSHLQIVSDNYPVQDPLA